MLERRADSPSYCFSEKSSEREERLERAGVSVTQAVVSLSSPPRQEHSCSLPRIFYHGEKR